MRPAAAASRVARLDSAEHRDARVEVEERPPARTGRLVVPRAVGGWSADTRMRAKVVASWPMPLALSTRRYAPGSRRGRCNRMMFEPALNVCVVCVAPGTAWPPAAIHELVI